MAGTKDRPKHGEGFSTVLYDAHYGDFTIALVKYGDVQKYGGLKLSLYLRTVWDKINKTALDPHFYPDNAGPVARFEPSEWGVIMALRATGFHADRTVAKLSEDMDYKIFTRLIAYNKGK